MSVVILRSVCLWLFAAGVSFAQTASPTACLSYGPVVVKLEGTLISKTYPVPPNNKGGAKANQPETYWLIKLSHPICVEADAKDPDLNPAHKDTRLIQLVLDPEVYKTRAKLLGKHVVATGTLFGGHTARHHTLVLLTVTTLEQL